MGPISVADKPGQKQARHVNPMRGRVRQGQGNVLVTLSRGPAGKSKSATIARYLGLSKSGDQALGWRTDKAWRGQLKAISHLVTVTFLEEVLVSDGPSNPDGARPPTKEELLVDDWSGPYEVGGTRGFFQRLMNDEYLHAESQGGGQRSVMWSTEQSLDTFLMTISKMLPQPSPDEEACWLTAKDEQEAPTRDLLIAEARRKAGIHLLQAEFPGTTVVWRRPFCKLAESRQRHAEAALVYDSDHSIDQSQVLDALFATGSPVVQQALRTQPGLLNSVLNIQ
jgi:ribosomal protein L30/L7E